MASFFNTPPKQIKITSDSQPLPSSGIEFSLTGMGGYTTIDWDFGDGKSPKTGQTTPNITHEYDNAGYYTIKATLKGDSCDPEAYVYFTFFVGEPKLDDPVPTTICTPGDPVELALVKDIGALEPYVWKEKSSGTVVGTGTSVTVTPAATTKYAVSTRVLDVWNRFTNGSFENAASHGGHGIIAADPKTVLSGINPGFNTVGMPDVNPGLAAGKKLAVDARGKAGQAFWKQTVPNIVANRDYTVSFYHRRLTNGTSPSNIRMKINGALVGPGIVPEGDWEKTEYTWNSGAASGSITFELVETTGSSGENFFALDDIVLNKIKEVEAEVTVTVNDVNPGEIESAFVGPNNFIVCRSSGTVGWLNEKTAASLAPGGSFTSWGYLWQKTVMGANAPEGDWDTSPPLSTAHAMSPVVPESDTWYRRKVTYTNDSVDCSKASNVLVVMVNDAKGGAIGPKTQTICQDGQAKLINQTEGYANGTRIYQWQSSAAGANTWTFIAGATGKDYTAPNVLEDTDYKRITLSVRTDPNGVDVTCEAESNVVTVKVKKTEKPTGDALQRDCAPGAIGDVPRKLSWLTVSGTALKWYDADRPGGNLITGDPNLVAGTTYWATQTLNGCESYNRLPVEYVKDVQPVGGDIERGQVGGIPGNPVICHDQPVPYRLESSDAGTAEGYIWKIKRDDGQEDELSHFGNGAWMQPQIHLDEKYLTGSPKDQNTYARYAYLKNHRGEYCMERSDSEVYIRVNHVAGGSVSGHGTVVCQYTPIDTLESQDHGGSQTNPPNLSYRWHLNGDPIAGTPATQKDYVPPVPAAHGTQVYRRRITSDMGGTLCHAWSNPATVTVREAKHKNGDGSLTCGLFPQKLVEDVSKNQKAEAGEVLTYTITIKNEWDRSVQGVVFSDTLPPCVKMDDPAKITGDGIYDAANRTITWTIASLDELAKAPNNQKSVSFKAVVEGDLTNCPEIKNLMEVTGTQNTPDDLPDGPEPADVDLETNRRLSIDSALTEKKVAKEGTSATLDNDNNPMVLAENELEYTITVKNGGDVDLPSVVVKDLLPVGTTSFVDMTNDADITFISGSPNQWTIGTLKWNEARDLKFRVKVKKDLTGVDSIRNTATVADTLFPFAFRKTDPKAGMKVTKKITNLPPGGAKFNLGDEIEYAITVENTGDLEIYNTAVTDPNADSPNLGTIPVLKVNDGANAGADWKKAFTAKHTVSQADVDAGMVANLAIASGTDANGGPVSETSEAPPGQAGGDCTDCPPGSSPPTDGSTVTAIDPGEAKADIKKVAVPAGKTDYKLGDKIGYQITVTNTGGRTLDSVTVKDSNADGGPWTVLSLPPHNSNVWTFTVEHTVTQDDLDKGRVDNTASVTSIPDKLGKRIDPPVKSNTITVNIKHDPKLTVTKTEISTGAKAGKYELDSATGNNVIEYQIEVKNNGLLTLKDILVEDPNANPGSLENTTIPGQNPILELAPGAAHVFTARHTVVQADVDAAEVLNKATAKGATKVTDVTADAESNEVKVEIHRNGPSMVLEKALVVPAKTAYTVNDDIGYTITVENTGDLTLRSIELLDSYAVIGMHPIDVEILPHASYAELAGGGLDGHIKRLAPGGRVTFKRVNHKVTQADIDRGQVDNWATATAADPQGNNLKVESIDASTPPCGTCDPVPGHPDATSVRIDQNPAWEMTKKVTSTGTGGSGKYKLNDVVRYLITVTNTGNVTLANVVVTDPNADEADLKTGRAITAPDPNGGEVTIEATHVVTQADVDAGAVKNLATAVGDSPTGAPTLTPAESKDPDGTNVPGDETEVGTEQTYGLKFTKQADRSKTNYAVGDKISYAITVENTGSTTIKNVTVTDTNADSGPLVFGPQDLAPGKVVVPVEHTVTAADTALGYVDNLAEFEGEDHTGTTVTDDSEDPDCPTCPNTTVPVKNPDPKIEMEKKVTNKASMPFGLGDQIQYEITVKNSGNVPLANVEVKDNNADSAPVGKSGEPNPIPVLMPGKAMVFTAEHTVTAADVAAGHVNNLASTKGKDPSGGDVTADSTDPDCPKCLDTSVPIGTPNPDMAVGKAVVSSPADPAKGYVLGETIRYEITVRNTGNTSLQNIEVKDNNADPVPGLVGKNGEDNPIPALLPGQEAVFTAEHKVTQADVDAGRVDNLASAEGKDPNGDAVTEDSKNPDDPNANPGDPTEVSIPQTHDMKVEKRESSTGPYIFGGVITYEIKVTNTGNTTLTNIVVTDPNATVTSGSPIAVLAPGDDATITAEHTVTQADVDAGKVLNTATADGEDSNGAPITADSKDPDDPNAEPGDATETDIDQQGGADMTVTKKVTSTGPYQYGSVITYEITVTNTGTLTLKDINIEDDNADAPDNKWNIPSLAPQDIPYVIQAKHTVTQADVDAGKVKNLASAAGKDPNTTPVTADSKDPNVPGSQPGDPTEVTNIPQVSGMEVTKKITSSGPYTLGDLIHYAIVVENTGNVTLKDIEVADANADQADANGIVGTIATLAPNDKEVIAVTHKVTQGDVDAGKVDNLATATGVANDPGKTPVGPIGSSDPDDPNANPGDPTEVTDIPQVLKMEVDKLVVSTPNDANAYQLGEAIKYTITVRNTGNVTLDNVIVTDINADEADLRTGRNIGTLVPLSAGGTVVTVGATHIVTQDDVDKGGVQNLAKVAGAANDPGKTPVTADSQDPDDPNANPGDPTEVEIPRTKGLVITKQADRSRTDYNVGDKIPYTITVENTGNTTITNVEVSDPNADLPNVWKFPALPPGKEVINATHTVTQADLDRRYVDNLATIAGTDYNGDPITDDSTDPDCPDCPETTVPVTDPKADMEMTKAVVNKGDMPFKQGDKIRYAITVKNRGNVVLTDVDVSDNNADAKPVDKNGGPNPILVLMPGAERVFTAEHTVTAADVAAGYVNNLATAEGKDPAGGDVTADSTDPDCPECPETTIPIGTPNPDMEVDKAVVGQPADPVLGYQLGERIEYAITVRNTGNVVLKDIKLTDDKADEENGAPWERTVDLLMPGKASDVFTAYHTITQADVDAGGVLNIALAKGKDPQNGDVTAESSDPNCGTPPCTGTEVEIVPRPGMRVDKVVADREHTYLEGERIAYRITVTNTGNVTLTNVEVRDDNADVSSTGLDEAGNSVPNPIPSLAPDAYVTFTAEHEVTVADLEAKYVYNLAWATATVPNGDEISQDSEDTEAKPRDGYDDLPEDPNCPSCTVIRVGVIPIAAEDDHYPVWTGQGTTTGSVLANDTFDGLSLSRTRRVELLPGAPDDPALMRMDPADGSISVRPGLRPGRHAYPYTIRQADYPKNLAQAVAYIDVVDPKRGLYIPNVFTPNGDGVNDTFEILGLEGHGIERISLIVADRAGRPLYENEDYRNEWDADGLPDGTYFYRIEAHGGAIGTKVFKGWVTVMRKDWK